jgi:glutamine cyclotransferase
MRSLRCAAAAIALVAGCSAGVRGHGPSLRSRPRSLHLTVVARHPHDPTAFTEGLVFVGDRLFESSGGYGSSDVREVDPDSGAVVRSAPLPGDEFGEGLAAAGRRLRQLTWREGIARSWSLDLAGGPVARYAGEGWGLSFDPATDRWVQSDGSASLTFRDRETFAPLGHLEVRRAGRPVTDLNELEVVGRSVWANVWKRDELVRIDVRSGDVTAVVDASDLVPPSSRNDPEAVLNGIAHRPGDPPERLWVTGKRWPTTYVVDVG